MTKELDKIQARLAIVVETLEERMDRTVEEDQVLTEARIRLDAARIGLVKADGWIEKVLNSLDKGREKC